MGYVFFLVNIHPIIASWVLSFNYNFIWEWKMADTECITAYRHFQNEFSPLIKASCSSLSFCMGAINNKGKTISFLVTKRIKWAVTAVLCLHVKRKAVFKMAVNKFPKYET